MICMIEKETLVLSLIECELYGELISLMENLQSTSRLQNDKFSFRCKRPVLYTQLADITDYIIGSIIHAF